MGIRQDRPNLNKATRRTRRLIRQGKAANDSSCDSYRGRGCVPGTSKPNLIVVDSPDLGPVDYSPKPKPESVPEQTIADIPIAGIPIGPPPMTLDLSPRTKPIYAQMQIPPRPDVKKRVFVESYGYSFEQGQGDQKYPIYQGVYFNPTIYDKESNSWINEDGSDVQKSIQAFQNALRLWGRGYRDAEGNGAYYSEDLAFPVDLVQWDQYLHKDDPIEQPTNSFKGFVKKIVGASPYTLGDYHYYDKSSPYFERYNGVGNRFDSLIDDDDLRFFKGTHSKDQYKNEDTLPFFISSGKRHEDFEADMLKRGLLLGTEEGNEAYDNWARERNNKYGLRFTEDARKKGTDLWNIIRAGDRGDDYYSYFNINRPIVGSEVIEEEEPKEEKRQLRDSRTYNIKAEGGHIDRWSQLSMFDRAGLINLYVKGGQTNLKKMRDHYNSLDLGEPFERAMHEVELIDKINRSGADFAKRLRQTGSWKDLSMKDRSAFMKKAVENGITNREDIIKAYEELQKQNEIKKKSFADSFPLVYSGDDEIEIEKYHENALEKSFDLDSFLSTDVEREHIYMDNPTKENLDKYLTIKKVWDNKEAFRGNFFEEGGQEEKPSWLKRAIVRVTAPKYEGDFREAFRTARKNGKEYFKWDGELYNTELKDKVHPFIEAVNKWDTKGDLAREDFKKEIIMYPNTVLDYYRNRAIGDNALKKVNDYDIEYMYGQGTGGLGNLVISRNTNSRRAARLMEAIDELDLTPIQKQAIYANSYHETNGWTALNQYNGPGTGYFHMEAAERKKYNSWRHEQGLPDSPKAEVQFIMSNFRNTKTPWDRMTDEERKAILRYDDNTINDPSVSGNTRSQYNHRNYTTEQALKDWDSEDLDRAITAFEGIYERAGKPALDRRKRVGWLMYQNPKYSFKKD